MYYQRDITGINIKLLNDFTCKQLVCTGKNLLTCKIIQKFDAYINYNFFYVPPIIYPTDNIYLYLIN